MVVGLVLLAKMMRFAYRLFLCNQRNLALKQNKTVLVYSGVGRSESVSRVHAFLEKMTEVVGGSFVANPAWTLLGAQEITVHPIYVTQRTSLFPSD